ncbi:acyl-homoserine-lactone synthase [Rhizobium sp. IY2]
MEKIWRFRHEQFVERLGWEALCRNDGLEIDQFDHDRISYRMFIRRS